MSTVSFIKYITSRQIKGRFYSFLGAIFLPVIFYMILSWLLGVLLAITSLDTINVLGFYIFPTIIDTFLLAYMAVITYQAIIRLLNNKYTKLSLDELFSIEKEVFLQVLIWQFIILVITFIVNVPISSYLINVIGEQFNSPEFIYTLYSSNSGFNSDVFDQIFDAIPAGLVFYSIALIIVSIIFGIITAMVNFNIIEEYDTFIEALIKSAKTMFKNFFKFLGLILSYFGVFLLGLMAFLVISTIISYTGSLFLVLLVVLAYIAFMFWFIVNIKVATMVFYYAANGTSIENLGEPKKLADEEEITEENLEENDEQEEKDPFDNQY